MTGVAQVQGRSADGLLRWRENPSLILRQISPSSTARSTARSESRLRSAWRAFFCAMSKSHW